mmetsp:Transcript_1768/g.5060  ORF Transcript_1768/g.5060 Transcript_1768/m.5060 type:complete len:223 (+) Transcript_1768:294-962(+)
MRGHLLGLLRLHLAVLLAPRLGCRGRLLSGATLLSALRASLLHALFPLHLFVGVRVDDLERLALSWRARRLRLLRLTLVLPGLLLLRLHAGPLVALAVVLLMLHRARCLGLPHARSLVLLPRHHRGNSRNQQLRAGYHLAGLTGIGHHRWLHVAHGHPGDASHVRCVLLAVAVGALLRHRECRHLLGGIELACAHAILSSVRLARRSWWQGDIPVHHRLLLC